METNNTIPRVTPEQIAALKERIEYRIEAVSGTTTTLCLAMLDGRFNLAIGKSACVDPRLFNAEVGIEIARRDAEAQATNKLWELEGYLLYDRIRTDFKNDEVRHG